MSLENKVFMGLFACIGFMCVCMGVTLVIVTVHILSGG